MKIADVVDTFIDGFVIPRLARGVRLRLDRIRHTHLLLRPEQGFELKGSALAIVKLCDGQRTVDQIVSMLTQSFAPSSPEIIARDVRALLTTLHARGLIAFEQEPS